MTVNFITLSPEHAWCSGLWTPSAFDLSRQPGVHTKPLKTWCLYLFTRFLFCSVGLTWLYIICGMSRSSEHWPINWKIKQNKCEWVCVCQMSWILSNDNTKLFPRPPKIRYETRNHRPHSKFRRVYFSTGRYRTRDEHLLCQWYTSSEWIRFLIVCMCVVCDSQVETEQNRTDKLTKHDCGNGEP